MAKSRRPRNKRQTPAGEVSAVPPRRYRWRLPAALALLVVLVWMALPFGALHQARQALAQRHFQSARAWLDWAEGWSGTTAESAFLRARAYRREGDLTRCREWLVKAREAGNPIERLEREQTLLLAQIGELKGIEPTIAKLLQSSDEDLPEVCEAFVAGLLLHFRHSEALLILQHWSQDFPRDPWPHVLQGRIYRGAGRLAEAEAAYRRASELEPASLDYLQTLADVMLDARRTDAAMPIYQTLTEEPATADYAWLKLAKCHRLLGQLPEAGVVLDRIRQPDRLPPGELELQRGLAAVDGGEYLRALDFLQEARHAQPRSLEVRHGMVQALRGAGRHADAAAEAELLARAEGALARSNQLHDDVIKNPTDPEPRVAIGRILLEFGDVARGVAWLRSAISLSPRHPEANRALAEYYEGQIDSPESRQLAAHYRRQLSDTRKPDAQKP